MGTKPGVKLDVGKPRWELLPLHAVEEMVKVLTYGAEKYSPNGWRRVPHLRSRYFAAALRHLVAYRHGQQRDVETEMHHLGHALCCIAFVLEKEMTDAERKSSSMGVRHPASRKRARKPKKARR